MRKTKDGSKPEIAAEFEDLAPGGNIDPKDEAIIRLRKEGKGYRDIQKELGVGQARIADVLKGAGLLGEQRRREEVRKTALLFDDELIGSFIELPFDFFSKRYGDFWKLSSDEKRKLSALSNRVAGKWLPLWLERFADEAALGFALLVAIYPRYLQTKEKIESQKTKVSESTGSLSKEKGTFGSELSPGVVS